MHTRSAHSGFAQISSSANVSDVSQSRCRPISERFSDRGGQDPIVEDLRRRDRNVFIELPPCRPFAISTFRSFFVSFRESMSWPSSIITVSSPWCRRRCASSPLPRDRSLAFYALKEEHNIMVCADNILHFVVSKCDVGLFKSVTLTHTQTPSLTFLLRDNTQIIFYNTFPYRKIFRWSLKQRTIFWHIYFAEFSKI